MSIFIFVSVSFLYNPIIYSFQQIIKNLLMQKEKKYILSKDIFDRKLKRLALEIVENNIGEQSLIFVGIEPKGVILARHLQKLMEHNSDIKIDFVSLSINKKMSGDVELSKPCDFDGKNIVLIDDVTNTGKTLLYAMKPFLEFHPKKIQTLVLVERSYTQFPVRANFKGISLATTLQENIVVEVDDGEITGAYLA